MKPKIEALINGQSPLILDLIEHIYFLKECKERVNEKHVLFNNHALQILHRNIFYLTILSLYKLIEDKHFTITKLNALIHKSKSFKAVEVEKLNEINRQINQLYNKQ